MSSGAPALMPASTGAKQKPLLDENSFQQLLAAAYVVQRHNDTLWIKSPHLDTARVLSEVSEMQALSQAGEVDVQIAGKLITERLLEIVGATGVSLGLINDGYLDCVAESGVPAKLPGSSLASHSLVATERLKSGEVFESRAAQQDMRLDANLCHALNVGSLIAAPVLRFGELFGLIEVRWARPQAFDDPGLLACRLMASLVTELLQRQSSNAKQLPTEAAPPVTTSQSSTSEGAKTEGCGTPPQLAEPEVIAESESMVNSEAPSVQAKKVIPDATPEVATSRDGNALPTKDASASPGEHVAEPNVAAATDRCRVCGKPFGADEAFCGFCSMPRTAANPSRELQSKWASLWFIQQAQGTLKETKTENIAPAAAVAPMSPQTPIIKSVDAAEVSISGSSPAFGSSPTEDTELPTATHARTDKDHFSYFEPAQLEHDIASEREFWEIAASAAQSSKSLIRKVRAKDVVLTAVALVLTFAVVSAWPSSSGRLTWFGSLIVRTGLARHSVPSYAGNPGVNVWVDEQTAQYYCPGEESYGNTATGHYATQLEAEQAQLQPASGLVCQ